MVVLPSEMFANLLEQTVAEISARLDPIAKIRQDELESGLSPKDWTKRDDKLYFKG